MTTGLLNSQRIKSNLNFYLGFTSYWTVGSTIHLSYCHRQQTGYSVWQLFRHASDQLQSTRKFDATSRCIKVVDQTDQVKSETFLNEKKNKKFKKFYFRLHAIQQPFTGWWKLKCIIILLKASVLKLKARNKLFTQRTCPFSLCINLDTFSSMFLFYKPKHLSFARVRQPLSVHCMRPSFTILYFALHPMSHRFPRLNNNFALSDKGSRPHRESKELT